MVEDFKVVTEVKEIPLNISNKELMMMVLQLFKIEENKQEAAEAEEEAAVAEEAEVKEEENLEVKEEENIEVKEEENIEVKVEENLEVKEEENLEVKEEENLEFVEPTEVEVKVEMINLGLNNHKLNNQLKVVKKVNNNEKFRSDC
jgi:hypothetical protein